MIASDLVNAIEARVKALDSISGAGILNGSGNIFPFAFVYSPVQTATNADMDGLNKRLSITIVIEIRLPREKIGQNFPSVHAISDEFFYDLFSDNTYSNNCDPIVGGVESELTDFETVNGIETYGLQITFVATREVSITPE